MYHVAIPSLGAYKVCSYKKKPRVEESHGSQTGCANTNLIKFVLIKKNLV